LKSRFSKAQKWIDTIKKDEGGFDKFTKVLVVYKKDMPDQQC